VASTHSKWLEQQSFEEPALQSVLADYRNEVEHQDDRLNRLERNIDHAAEQAPTEIRAVVQALQALRGVAKTTAVGLVAEIGKFSRFERPGGGFAAGSSQWGCTCRRVGAR
jgi:hypothetical protein